MEKLMRHTEDIINTLSSNIVLLEPDDIQGLGEVLKLLDEIHDDSIQEYTSHVRTIAERLILDEYEAPTVGIQELNDAAEQLQLAFSDTQKVSNEELQQKQQQLKKEDETAPSSDSQTVEVERPTIILEEEPPKAKQTESKSSAPTPKQEAKTFKEQPKQKASAPAQDDTVENDFIAYFDQQDDVALINQTLLDDPELVQGFVEETVEHVQEIESGIIDWETSPTDLDIIDSIFRPFHTIKGVSGFLNLTDINSFSHMFEDILDQVRKGELHYSDDLVQVIFEGIDAIKKMVESLTQSLDQKSYVPHHVNLEQFGQKLTAIRHGRSLTSGTTEPEPVPTQKVNEPFQSKTSSDTGKSPKNTSTSKPESSTTSSAFGDPTQMHGTRATSATKDSSLRVSTLKMDSLIDLVGELVVTQNMVVQNDVVKMNSDKRLMQDVSQLKRITSNLQDLSMSLRMVPIKDTFQKMHRIVRDLSRKSGKKIVLDVHGEDTEIDRNMVDELYDPLVHMIRNNCDHGIELPEERKRKGKNPTGTITLNAFYKGGNVIIEVRDNGKGIDVERIFKRAVDRGLAKRNDKLSESEILNFIFASGFSTSEKVTDVSGRGVGMDVVKRVISNLRGSIEINTEKDKGTIFSLRLPLTLAIIDGVIVQVGEEKYIIPTVSIKESLSVKPEMYNKIAGKGETLFIRDKVLPLIRLDDYFGIKDGVRNPSDGLVVIVESDKQEAALLVDKMLDKQEIVIKSLGESLSKVKGLAGGAILSDGTVGLIVDVPTLLPQKGRSFKDY